ncbi:hypothetical protein F0231_19665 [Vibrio sp. RE86]|uniref:hypothetical protein n=1 Tax=Vibrio sp. RE86 TaxID=2607605 RepID=UPI001493CA05|nr:hypothetical protein [Vibrio sp. RE86]NOH81950.1 hypothetical protein [Vibrio sp. RE86]
MKKTLLATTITLLALTGCNSNDNTASSTTPTTSSYNFIDEAVKGLYYESATQSGCTDDTGLFSIQDSESVDFYLGRCDENNQPNWTDNDIKIGTVTNASTTTTPFDLLVNSNSESADAVTVATILKSLTSDAGAAQLDLSGLYLNENGVDVRTTLQNLINSPSTDATTVLTSALFTQIETANTSKAQPLEHSAFKNETDVENELRSTLDAINGELVFLTSDLVGKTATTPAGVTYTFGAEDSAPAQGYYSASGALKVNNPNDPSLTDSAWGIFNGSQFADAGELYIPNGYTIHILDKRTDSWLVSIDDGGLTERTEKWSIN